MTVRFEHEEIEALLSELEKSTGLGREDVVLDALRKERERLADQARREAEGLAIDEEIRRRWNARPLVDPRPVDEILAYDENGLPV